MNILGDPCYISDPGLGALAIYKSVNGFSIGVFEIENRVLAVRITRLAWLVVRS